MSDDVKETEPGSQTAERRDVLDVDIAPDAERAYDVRGGKPAQPPGNRPGPTTRYQS